MTGTTNLKMWLTICSLMFAVVSAVADTHYVNSGDSIQAAINAGLRRPNRGRRGNLR